MYSLGELARLIKCELIGDPEIQVGRALPFELAVEDSVTYAIDPALVSQMEKAQAAAFIVAKAVQSPGCNLLISRDPKLAFARAVQLLNSIARPLAGVNPDLIIGDGSLLGEGVSVFPRVTIGRDSRIGNGVCLYPGVVIGDHCEIGDNSVIYPNVSIYDDVRIGSRVIIHSGSVIGADGFGFVVDEAGHQVKVLQTGSVIIGDDCEIGANCAIDRGSFGPTVLGCGVKLDNLIQVGHNCEIGDDTVVAALTGFSGGTKVGRNCRIAGQVGTREHISIGDGSVVMGQAGVTKSVRPGSTVGGVIPAQDYEVWRRRQAQYSRLPELAERLRKVEQSLSELRSKGRDNIPDSA